VIAAASELKALRASVALLKRSDKDWVSTSPPHCLDTRLWDDPPPVSRKKLSVPFSPDYSYALQVVFSLSVSSPPYRCHRISMLDYFITTVFFVFFIYIHIIFYRLWGSQLFLPTWMNIFFLCDVRHSVLSVQIFWLYSFNFFGFGYQDGMLPAGGGRCSGAWFIRLLCPPPIRDLFYNSRTCSHGITIG